MITKIVQLVAAADDTDMGLNAGEKYYPRTGADCVVGLDEKIADGQRGEDGKSAYELAVADGFSGTEAEWLASLKGPAGKDGAPGTTGPQGPKGDKGDTGTVDNTGLINSQAFQSLQTQVDNSAVGTNLLTGTGSHVVTATGTGVNAFDYLSNETTNNLLPLLKGLEGQTVTVSVEYKYSGFIAGSGNNRLGWEAAITADRTSWPGSWYFPNNDSGSGRMSSTFVVPKSITGVDEGYGYIQFSGSGTGTLSHLKLEKGSVATDWCPNPSEILTKGDTGPTGPQGPQGPAGKDAVSQIIDGENSTTNGRAVNSPPSYYQTNYPAKEVREFKQTANVGVTLVSGQTSTYGILSTRVPGTDTGFGRPRQNFEPTLTTRPLTYVRIGISDMAWSDWELVTTW